MARDLGLLVLRLAGFYLAAAHGWGKLIALGAGETRFVEGVAHLGFPLPVVFAWAAVLAEFAGGLGLGLGLFTRWAGAFVAFNMLVAAFLQHHALAHFLAWLRVAPAADDVVRSWGNPEMAILYLLVALTLVLLGAGRFSLDARLGRS
jgi:putative oxidoreductase